MGKTFIHHYNLTIWNVLLPWKHNTIWDKDVYFVTVIIVLGSHDID